MSNMIAAITPLFNLLKNMPVPAAYDEIDPELALKLSAEESQARLEKLQQAVAALKTAPAAEGRQALTEFVEALFPVMAYSINVAGDNAPTQIREYLSPLLSVFSDIYRKKYSENATEERRKNGIELNPDESAREQEFLVRLNALRNNLDDTAAVRQFLLQLNAKDHPDLFNPMVDALMKYRRENMGNFQRFLENFGKEIHQTLHNQSQHADYLQGWERLGYMIGKIILAVSESLTFTALGLKLPLTEEHSNDNTASNSIPVGGRLIPRAAPAA